ncbi:PVC-type heme-binding CxxCH protein [Pedobacter psychroterrae]|uniref:C-type cytochrome n=1 Tax=Pedobacter psychroterrae TaxID=2530453 RepID=A0A4R0NIA3_9SPHI|nr:PVC-type heme-binding CxxCH protein [Pedobacter psychroterrae]TCD00196.1 c-type cytochrome [Pedobacter psychroterrae]
MKLGRYNTKTVLLCGLLLAGLGCNVSKKNQNKSGLSNLPAVPYPGPEKFVDHIRTTEFQSPAQEQAGFKLPEGFEITLYASEPDIGKPINMEFDERGRLWVTQSSEYPMAAPSLKGHDKITVLEDTDGDGKADKFTPFASDLNIPIGIIPVRQGAIAFSIPNVYKFTDKDGDGVSDEKKVLFGEFGHQDTHGMVNNFARGFDGWIYACHGFTNTSTIAGMDGDSLTMVSGNTFRFREDGSRIEQTSFGRVNPFGYTFDEYGYLYSVDCHSKPIYQLIRGGEYPHFGKKAPAMGYAPEMMSYELGSTALSGLDYYLGEQFPEEYRHSFYNGDVVTCRINRNTMKFNGSSPEAVRKEDFLISADPWFRPVAVKEGPDGALYIADFYNRIIGHYEVSLDHPLRDRQSGRIWRIAYVGKRDAKGKMIASKDHVDRKVRDWSKVSLDELIKNLDYSQLNMRMMIANELVQRFGNEAVKPLKKWMEELYVSVHPSDVTSKELLAEAKSYVQGLWALYRLNGLTDVLINNGLDHWEPLVRVHTFRILAEMKEISAAQRARTITALTYRDVHVRRAAGEVLGKHVEGGSIAPLLALYEQTEEKDGHLRYTVLLALRNNMRNKAVMQAVVAGNWSDAQLSVLMNVVRDVASSEGALFAMKYLETHDLPKAELLGSLEYIGRFLPAGEMERPIKYIEKKFADDVNTQYLLFNTMQQGLQQSGGVVVPKMKEWGISLAVKALEGVAHPLIGTSADWSNRPLLETGDPENPWAMIDRAIVGELPRVKLMWSEFNWYAPTGVLVSPVFKLPASLKISVFDNDVHNTEAKTGVSKNSVRIVLAKSRKVIGMYRSSFTTPMTNADLMKEVPFDLSKYAGQMGYVEVVDSTKTGSIGVGGFKPAVLSIPDIGLAEAAEKYTRAAEIVGLYKVASQGAVMKTLLLNKRADYKTRTAAAGALLSIDPAGNSGLVEGVFLDLDESQLIKEKMAQVLGQSSSPSRFLVLQKGLAGSGRALQLAIATILVNSSDGAGKLLDAVKQGDVKYDLLTEIAVKERLASNMNAVQRVEFERLSVGQASESEARKVLIAARMASYDPSAVSVEEGKAMFAQHCSMCHQIKGVGGMIGPQLDGIGNWGRQALTEKVLDPNRNISQSFRTYTITLKNGKVLSGLFRREEGAVLVFANPGGEEFSVVKGDIKERVVSKYTLMPDQFRNTIAKKDFDALMKFLLATREK